MIDKSFPRPQELKELDRGTLGFLRCAPIITNNFPTLSQSANEAYGTINVKAGPLRFESKLPLFIEQPAESPPRDVFVGALIEVKSKACYEKVSYSVTIGNPGIPKTPLLRKFHFDYEDHDNRNLGEPKPSFHLQFCGKLTPELKKIGYGDADIEHLCPWLSKPRIPFMPMSLALVLNMVFLECRQTQAAHKVIESPEWRGIVEKNEETILKPFFRDCARFVAGPDRRLITNEFFYNKH